MRHPFDDPVLLSRLSEAELRRKLTAATGFWASKLAADGPILDPLANPPAEEPSPIGQALAREILLLPPAPRASCLRRFPHWAALRPFKGLPPLAALADLPAALALFPLAAPSGAPPGLGVAACIGERTLLIEESGRDFHGNSSDLAAALCRRLAPANDPAAILRLATFWICSGALAPNGSDILTVEVGNKADLAHRIPGRSWLVPPGFALPTTVHRMTVTTLDDSHSLLLRRGIVQGEILPWSDYEGLPMYSFTSQALEPVVMACVLARPSELTLFHSSDPDSWQAASRLSEWIPTYLGLPVKPPIPCEDSRTAILDRQLRDLLEPRLRTGGRLLFNVTQGNLLMRSVPFLLAREYPELWLIYRNVRIRRPEFELLHFLHHIPLNQILAGTEGDPRVRWPVLYDNNAGRFTDPVLYEQALFGSFNVP